MPKYKNENYYTPAYLLNSGRVSDKEMRAEYSRLRSIARKRLERFQGTMWQDTQVYRKYKDAFPQVKGITSNREMAYRLSAVYQFLNLRAGSVSALNKRMQKVISTLHKNGYTFVNKGNFRQFTDFMDEYRAQKLDKLYDSKDVADVFSHAERLKVDPMKLYEDFMFWMDNRKILAGLQPTKAKQQNINRLRRRVEKAKVIK